MIDKALQGHGYGKGLLEWTVTLVRDKVSTYVGCRFLVVDAKQDSISFYEKAGFSLFNTEVPGEHPLRDPLGFKVNYYQVSQINV